MSGIHRWLASASILLGAVASFAQNPASLPSQITASAPLPGGTVVSELPSPPVQGTISILPPASTVRVVELPKLVTESGPPPLAAPVDVPFTTLPGGNDIAAPLMPSPPVPQPTLGSGTPTHAWGTPANCCGPVGGDGPIGGEIYLRVGASYPIENDVLSRNLQTGRTIQIGGRSQFFDPTGSTAWVVDLHLVYSNNQGKREEQITYAGEPLLITGLTRWAFGIGLGEDYFLARPGFILDTWDANFRIGWDAGGRYGTGHVDFSPFLERNGYRRNHDVFAQAFAGVMATMEIPMGGYTALFGGRIEWDYTFSDFLERGSGFHEVSGLFSFGVRY